MSQGPTVLLVEADPSLRRLISLGLQHQGWQVIEANSCASTPTYPETVFDLLVVDIDSGVNRNLAFLEHVQADPSLAELPTVLLSWDQSPVQTSLPEQAVCLSKPFDARALYTAATHLLQVRAERLAAQVAQAEERLLATYRQQTAPSIWPIITAAGMLLVVTGMLMQLAIAIVGIVIVAMAIIMWGVGTHSSQNEIAPTLSQTSA
ncbi:response regulator [Tengunoibacter tsumagoiensis]|uniref:Response regulatory domain-containing protein n=1 Tax=Tengunoibacter tsumagoiensis TaxID=2014871 RepID=A0A402A5Q5_9CHLR|nr:hypothetical protein [Tengunoibacter tsumagoiensis]GCE14386.1 hypothetical protein KTT_42450 [Tengunoibacter tsumagoiensis]